MSILKSMNLVLTAFLFLIISHSVFSQKIEPKKRITEPDHTISSKVMGKDYQLYISFPTSYSIKDTITYPVLYVLDGESSFPAFTSAQEIMSLGEELEDVIIVGIGSGLDLPTWLINRSFDYTTSIDTNSLNGMEEQFGLSKGSIKTGGASKFLEFIKTEVAQLVDKNYKTNNDRGITGHSLGGLFTAYCLINSDGYFTRFGINSPSLWWDNEELLNQGVTAFKNNNKIQWNIPPTKVFISVGELEGPLMVPTMLKLSTNLEELSSNKIDLEWHIFENETHLSVTAANMNRTLSVLYGKE